jgi:hypothetical protein
MCRLARGDLEFVVVLSSVLFLFFRQEFRLKNVNLKKNFKPLTSFKAFEIRRTRSCIFFDVFVVMNLLSANKAFTFRTLGFARVALIRTRIMTDKYPFLVLCVYQLIKAGVGVKVRIGVLRCICATVEL